MRKDPRDPMLLLSPRLKRPFGFVAWTGVEKAVLRGDGEIAGMWQTHPGRVRVDVAPKFLVEFVNWLDDPASILDFTRLYGPLDVVFEEDGEFHFHIEEWRKHQAEFRKRWEGLILNFPPGKGLPFILISHAPVVEGEQFEFAEDYLQYRASTLYRLLEFELLLRPRDRVRKCLRPDCSHPYYIASSLHENYCSQACSNAAQRQWKREWWSKERTRRKAEAAKRKKK
jgi:hypothetical protein